jgi:hypothetical protein
MKLFLPKTKGEILQQSKIYKIPYEELENFFTNNKNSKQILELYKYVNEERLKLSPELTENEWYKSLA